MNRPPKLAERLFVWMFRRNRNMRSTDPRIQERMSETVAGDLEEVYQGIKDSAGSIAANRWYWSQVMQAIPSFILFMVNHHISMLHMHLKTALRHFKRTFWYTSINVIGLSIALCVSILAFLFAKAELEYDAYHPHSDQLYRVGMSVFFDEMRVFEATPFPLATELEETVPDVEVAFRFTAQTGKNIRSGNETVESSIHLVDNRFLSEFDFPMALGSNEGVFNNPTNSIISSDLRLRLFGQDNPIGRTLSIELARDKWVDVVVRGVLQPVERATNLKFDILVSENLADEAFGEAIYTDWMPKSPTVTFIRLRQAANLESVRTSLNEVARQHDLTQFTEGHEVEHLLPIEKLSDAHFSSLFRNRILAPNGDRSQLFVLLGIAFLMLLIASVNFVNLSTGLSTSRSKEVGVRKVFGAIKRQLATQYLFENTLLVLLSLLLALFLVAQSLPAFNNFTEQQLVFRSLFSGFGLAMMGFLILVVSFAAGAYPALVMSRFKPIEALRPAFKLGNRHVWSRFMIGFQFVTSIFLVATTLAVNKQLDHIGSQDLGFNSEHVLLQRLSRGVGNDIVQRYRESLQNNPNIQHVAGARATILGDGIDSAISVTFNEQEVVLSANKIDADFLPTLGIQLVDGRNFAPGFVTNGLQSDENSVIVNEAFVKFFQLTNPVGAPTPFAMSRTGPANIIGVVKDYHYLSLKHSIEPIVLYPRTDSDNRQIFIRIVGTNVEETIAALEDTWNKLETGAAFNYTFLDDAIQQQYLSEQRIRGLGRLASSLSVFIAFLGLFGLTSLSVQRRTKEIGIRKVLGASPLKIIALFNLEYATLIVVSSGLAFGLTWFALHEWLEQFTYRILVPIELIGISCAGLTAFAILVISTQTYSASIRNPVYVIRYE